MIEKNHRFPARLKSRYAMKLTSAAAVVSTVLAFSAARSDGQDLPLTAGVNANQIYPVDPARIVTSPQLEGARISLYLRSTSGQPIMRPRPKASSSTNFPG